MVDNKTVNDLDLQERFGHYGAFLFDCDGTIADSMPVHLLAWNKALAKWGTELTLEQHLAWAGRPTGRIVEMLNELRAHEPPISHEEIMRDKEVTYQSLIHTIMPIEAVARTISLFHGRVPFAVVSGSRRASIEKTLKHLHLLDKFDALVGAEDYAHGKPAPDCFLLGAEKLNVEPARCLVFEDADLGVEAARAAGMDWMRVGLHGFEWDRSRLGAVSSGLPKF